MTTFTIDEQNNITAFASPQEAAGASTTPFDTFSSQQDLAALIAQAPAARLVAIWNSLPGVTPVRKFKDRLTAVARIWKRIQSLGEAAPPDPPQSAVATPRKPKGAPAKAQARRNASPAKGLPKGKKTAQANKTSTTRTGSKTAQVVALLRRKNGVTLAEIVEKMGWQKHTVRGFMAGAMKKAGYQVESFKPEGGQRTYRINP